MPSLYSIYGGRPRSSLYRKKYRKRRPTFKRRRLTTRRRAAPVRRRISRKSYKGKRKGGRISRSSRPYLTKSAGAEIKKILAIAPELKKLKWCSMAWIEYFSMRTTDVDTQNDFVKIHFYSKPSTILNALATLKSATPFFKYSDLSDASKKEVRKMALEVMNAINRQKLAHFKPGFLAKSRMEAAEAAVLMRDGLKESLQAFVDQIIDRAKMRPASSTNTGPMTMSTALRDAASVGASRTYSQMRETDMQDDDL